MYRMGLMALIAPDIPGIDRDKLVFFVCVCVLGGGGGGLLAVDSYWFFFQVYKNGDSS